VGEIRGSSGGTPGAVEACERGHQGAICGLDLVDLALRKEREPISRRAAMDESRRCGGAGRGWGARQIVHQIKCGRLHYLLK
jgi:hypothetical protein